MAIDDINNAGGIKALGGAKLRLIEYDTGDSAEKAKDAAQRMIAQEPDLVGGFGCWLSTFTLAATEVTERAELPWLTLSYSDLITGRGFKYVFQSSPTADAQAEDVLPMVVELAEKASGKRPTKVAFVGDNTAAVVSFMKPIRDHVLKNLEPRRSVADEVYTPPLTDATTIVQHVRSARPDFVMFQSTNVPDDKLLVRQVRRDATCAATGCRRSAAAATGRAGTAEGRRRRRTWKACWSVWPTGRARRWRTCRKRFVERTKEPWFGHDSIFAYVHVLILKEALERAGVADRHKVMQAIRELDMKRRPGAVLPRRAR